jgi:hypothetical protein
VTRPLSITAPFVSVWHVAVVVSAFIDEEQHGQGFFHVSG